MASLLIVCGNFCVSFAWYAVLKKVKMVGEEESIVSNLKSKSATLNKKQIGLMLVVSITLFSVTHLLNGPTDGMDTYLLLFAIFYSIVIVLSVIFAVLLKKGWRVLAIVNILLAACLLIYDIFGIALGAMQF